MTLDECKTLTKISTLNLSQQFPQTSARFGHDKNKKTDKKHFALIKYRDAFSLRDEIGECPNLKADIKVIDESPFFVRPFPISEKDKPFMDEQMED